ncbi:MAG: Rieske 2Fe-2S domain-containing protein [Immundisolibacter sp.]|uniref:Rieske 2Fe-2S domain-containing protein n=1 Tax=Immundisolibacter sp. TaxID=1934948 RepID=UPI003D0BEFFC
MNKPLVNPQIGQQIRDWRPYFEAKLGFRNHWYPVMYASDLAEGEVKPGKLLGEDLLLRRTEGAIYCIKDQCLHRGVPLSRKPECYSKDTVTCWYHGWTYQWADGKLCDILTDPSSRMIGTRGLKTYPVQEAKGMVFVFMGDLAPGAAPPALGTDLPPGFLDPDRAAYGIRRLVKANWRLGAENGFDTTHIFIHKDSPFITGRDSALPLGFASAGELQLDLREDPAAPRGVVDNMVKHYRPLFESTLGGQTVLRTRAPTGKHNTIHTISLWMPGILSVENHPELDMVQYEFYTPHDADHHMYYQVIEKIGVADAAAEAAFRAECEALHEPLALRGINDDDLWAREAMQGFYADDWGWLEEQLFEQDRNLLEWRRLASRCQRGVQTLAHVQGGA